MQGRNRDTKVKNGHVGISLVVHQLRLHTLNAEGLGSISGQGTNLTCLQLRAGATKFKKKKRRRRMDMWTQQGKEKVEPIERIA